MSLTIMKTSMIIRMVVTVRPRGFGTPRVVGWVTGIGVSA
jgi:hypothetical protein